MMLFVYCARAKRGCGRLQLPASVRPETVNRSSTPPFGAFGLGLPDGSKKNGKRTSRVGPLDVMNEGIPFVDPIYESVGNHPKLGIFGRTGSPNGRLRVAS